MAIDRRMVQLRDDLGLMIQACDYETTTLVETLLDRIAKDIEGMVEVGETMDTGRLWRNETRLGLARWLRGQP